MSLYWAGSYNSPGWPTGRAVASFLRRSLAQPKVVQRFLSVVAPTFGSGVPGGGSSSGTSRPGLDPAAALPLSALQQGGSGTPTRAALDALERIQAAVVTQFETCPPAGVVR